MRTRIILPYFGSFNEYFPLWLHSCSQNPEFEWLIFTDCGIQESLPKNVTVINTTLSILKQKFQNKLNLTINLETAYKLCDYKPFYGFLFSEYLEGYDYWGYCDCDVIFGDFRNFFSCQVQKQYDKIFRTGHLCLVRNTDEINRLFQKYSTYKISLTSPVIFGYDESIKGYHLGFAGELLENGYSLLNRPDWVGDIDFRHYPFRDITKPDKPCIFSYENGKIFRIDFDGQKIQKEEKLYVHLQKRKMTVDNNIRENKYFIIPNRFCAYDEKLLQDTAFWHSVSNEQQHYYNFRLEKWQNQVRDVKRFLHEPQKIGCILYRLRG